MNKEFIKILYAGIILLSSCIIGTAISSLNVYNDIVEMQHQWLLIPKL